MQLLEIKIGKWISKGKLFSFLLQQLKNPKPTSYEMPSIFYIIGMHAHKKYFSKQTSCKKKIENSKQV